VTAPVEDRWFEDYEPGSVHQLGEVTLDEAEIIAFASAYDPQRIHTDPAWSQTGPFDGLIASGVHTLAACMRLYVEHYVSRVASLASPGLDELRWPRPVRPGDTLSVRAEVVSARLSSSRPDRGIVTTQAVATNQDDEPVLSFTAVNFFAVRPVSAGQP
jgi:acyl dehydratase